VQKSGTACTLLVNTLLILDISFQVFTAVVALLLVFFWVSVLWWLNVPFFRRNVVPPS
jgi:hypothetical protein